MELLQLRYFQTVAKMESISNAAKFHRIPQSSMSQTIKRLERELGDIELFDRRNGRLYLNERGQNFLEYVDRTLTNLDSGIRAVTSNDKEVAGPLRLKVMENHRLVLTCVPKFSEMYPNVQLTISHGYYEDLDTVYDVCISSRMQFRQLTAFKPLLQENLILAVHEGHPLAQRDMVSIDDLRGEKLITLPSQSQLHETIVSCCLRKGFEPEIPIICDDPYFVRKYVSENLGVTIAPEISWKGRFRSNTRLVPFVEEDMQICSYILWNKDRYMSPPASKFIDYILEEARKL